jgi:undecaprenyl-diphosphatase
LFHLSYFQAIFIGLLQGVTELFPISSLGHSVLIPALFGWHGIVNAQSGETGFLAFLVGLHCGTAIALLIYYRALWKRIIPAFFRTIPKRRIETKDEKLAWLLVAATIPAGLTGLALEHSLRTVFAKPTAAASFLFVNGIILAVGERVRRKTAPPAPRIVPVAAGGDGDLESDTEAVSSRAEAPGSLRGAEGDLTTGPLGIKDAIIIGIAQIGALFAGVSRSGITMVAGLFRGLDHEDAARFTFLLATPIILAAGVYKLGDLTGHLGDGVRGQTLAAAVVAGIAAYCSVAFLERYFTSRNLNPFAVYCLVMGAGCLIRFAAF